MKNPPTILEEILQRLSGDDMETYQEVAAIMQYDGKMSREVAELNSILHLLLKKYPDCLKEKL